MTLRRVCQQQSARITAHIAALSCALPVMRGVNAARPDNKAAAGERERPRPIYRNRNNRMPRSEAGVAFSWRVERTAGGEGGAIGRRYEASNILRPAIAPNNISSRMTRVPPTNDRLIEPARGNQIKMSSARNVKY